MTYCPNLKLYHYRTLAAIDKIEAKGSFSGANRCAIIMPRDKGCAARICRAIKRYELLPMVTHDQFRPKRGAHLSLVVGVVRDGVRDLHV